MAINHIQTQIIDRMADVAKLQLELMGEYAAIVQFWGAESVANLADEDMATLPELSHVTVAELTSAKNAFNDLLTAGGGYATNTVMTRLSKIVKQLP